MKALVVDSSNTMRSVLHRILSMRGFEVTEADNCQQAMDVLRMMGAPIWFWLIGLSTKTAWNS